MKKPSPVARPSCYHTGMIQKILIVFALLLSWRARGADRGIEVGVGPAMIEEGDDRFRPGAMAHVGINKDWYFRFYSYGRTFGPVKERTWMLSGSHRMPMFGTQWLSASLGLVAMNESTEIKFADAPDENSSADSFNLGATAGLHFQIPTVAPIYLECGWDSHIFLAGLNGGLFLANGRKQTLSFGLGVRL